MEMSISADRITRVIPMAAMAGKEALTSTSRMFCGSMKVGVTTASRTRMNTRKIANVASWLWISEKGLRRTLADFVALVASNGGPSLGCLLV